jgi:hypothetical protein
VTVTERWGAAPALADRVGRFSISLVSADRCGAAGGVARFGPLRGVSEPLFDRHVRGSKASVTTGLLVANSRYQVAKCAHQAVYYLQW